jgi:hypothetical protein
MAEKPQKMHVNPLCQRDATLKIPELAVISRFEVNFEVSRFSRFRGVAFYFIHIAA